MGTADLLARIAPKPGKMGGKPVFRGRRVTPSMVLTMLANGASREAVLEAYPVLEPADIDACLLYAARLSELAAAEGHLEPSPKTLSRFLSRQSSPVTQQYAQNGNRRGCVD